MISGKKLYPTGSVKWGGFYENLKYRNTNDFFQKYHFTIRFFAKYQYRNTF